MGRGPQFVAQAQKALASAEPTFSNSNLFHITNCSNRQKELFVKLKLWDSDAGTSGVQRGGGTGSRTPHPRQEGIQSVKLQN